MAGEILDALKRLNDRKSASGMSMEKAGQGLEEEMFRRIWSGLDIDVAEITELRPTIAHSAIAAILEGNSPVTVAAGMWFDGIAMGLLIAEARQKAVADA